MHGQKNIKLSVGVLSNRNPAPAAVCLKQSPVVSSVSVQRLLYHLSYVLIYKFMFC